MRFHLKLIDINGVSFDYCRAKKWMSSESQEVKEANDIETKSGKIVEKIENTW